MTFKEFKGEVGRVLASKITMEARDVEALGGTYKVRQAFIKEHPEYSECSYTEEYSSGVWTISYWTTTKLVFKEV